MQNNTTTKHTEVTMSNNKQSSVEWLMEIDKSWSITMEEWQQAKAMHKDEIIKAVKYGFNREYFTPNFQDQKELFEQYYG